MVEQNNAMSTAKDTVSNLKTSNTYKITVYTIEFQRILFIFTLGWDTESPVDFYTNAISIQCARSYSELPVMGSCYIKRPMSIYKINWSIFTRNAYGIFKCVVSSAFDNANMMWYKTHCNNVLLVLHNIITSGYLVSKSFHSITTSAKTKHFWARCVPPAKERKFCKILTLIHMAFFYW